MKLDLFEILDAEFPRCHHRVFAALSILLLFCALLGSAQIVHADFTLSSPAQTETTVTLTWPQSSDLIFYSYTLYFSTSVNGPYSDIWSTGDRGHTSYGVSGLSSNTNYYFYIHDSGFLVSYDTNTLQVTTASNPQLAPITSYDYTSATVSWTDYNSYSTLEPFVSYTLQMSSLGLSGPWSTIATLTDPSQNNYRQMGLFHQEYWFQLYDTVGPSGSYQISYSNIVSVAIPTPFNLNITASLTKLDVSQRDQFSASATGGLPPYSNYQWYLNGNPITGATSPGYSWTPTKEGTYTVYATAQDTLNIPIDSNTITLQVNHIPWINISASTYALNVSQSCQLSSSFGGGASPYSFQWYLNGNPIGDATSSSYSWNPSQAGTYTVYATVKDSYNVTASSLSVQVAVAPNPSSSPLPLLPIVIVAVVIIVIAIVGGALALRSRRRNKTQKKN